MVIEKYAWYEPIVDFLARGRLSFHKDKARNARRVAVSYIIQDGVLYQRGLDGILLQCLTQSESLRAMKEAHAGSCIEHQGGQRL